MGRAVLRRGPRPRQGRVRAGRPGLSPDADHPAHRRAGLAPSPLPRFRDQPWSTRAHVRGRWLACPFDALAAEVPPAGRVLDVGCGHGLLTLHLGAGSSDREVLGVDIDEAKLVAARQAAGRAPSLTNVSFASTAGLEGLEGLDGPFDAVTVIDVLYLLTADHQEALVRSLARRLAPGGQLLVKEMAPTPRWKHRWMHAEEVLATRVAGITASRDGVLHHTAPIDLRRWMAGEGLEVSDRRLDRRRPYPHHLVLGRAPDTSRP